MTVSVTYGDDTVDIYTDVKELLLEHQKIGEGLASALMELIDENIESIEGVKNHKSCTGVIDNNSDNNKKKKSAKGGKSHKRQKIEEPEPEDSEPTVTPKEKIVEAIDSVMSILQLWLPAAEFQKRRLGRKLYMKLLILIKQQIQAGNKSFVLEEIADHIQEVWKPITDGDCKMSEVEDQFMTEVRFLVNECCSVKKLKPSVETLLSEFKQQMQKK